MRRTQPDLATARHRRVLMDVAYTHLVKLQRSRGDLVLSERVRTRSRVELRTCHVTFTDAYHQFDRTPVH